MQHMAGVSITTLPYGGGWHWAFWRSSSFCQDPTATEYRNQELRPCQSDIEAFLASLAHSRNHPKLCFCKNTAPASLREKEKRPNWFCVVLEPWWNFRAKSWAAEGEERSQQQNWLPLAEAPSHRQLALSPVKNGERSAPSHVCLLGWLTHWLVGQEPHLREHLQRLTSSSNSRKILMADVPVVKLGHEYSCSYC